MLAAWLKFWSWSRPGCAPRFGEPDARAAVTFLGAERIEVLRFLDGDVRALRHARDVRAADDRPRRAARRPGARARARNCCCPCGPAAAPTPTRCCGRWPCSPRRRRSRGSSSPPAPRWTLGEPLWPGAPFTSVLVAEPGGLVEDLALDAPQRTGALPPAAADDAERGRLEAGPRRRRRCSERWLAHGTDLRDPLRAVRAAGRLSRRAPRPCAAAHEHRRAPSGADPDG